LNVIEIGIFLTNIKATIGGQCTPCILYFLLIVHTFVNNSNACVCRF